MSPTAVLAVQDLERHAVAVAVGRRENRCDAADAEQRIDAVLLVDDATDALAAAFLELVSRRDN